MSRILSAPLLDRKGSWVLGVALAISLVVGCGSQGDNGDDNSVSTGGKGYVVGTGGVRAGAGGGVVYITGLGGNRATGGRAGFGQGGVAAGTGGQVASTSAANCTTGTVGCPCYVSGTSKICNGVLTCNSSNVCVSSVVATGGAPGTGGVPGTGGTKATGGAGVGGVVGAGGASVVTGGATSVAGSPATGGVHVTATGGSSPFVTGGAPATGGAPEDGGVVETGGAGGGTSVPTCSNQNVVNTPNGVVSCSGDCTITGTLTSGASLTYDCDCATGNVYVCFGGSTTVVACPASVALEPASGVACSTTNGDDFCKLTATTKTVSGGTTTISTTTYSCSCGSTTKLWSCTK